MGGEGVCSPSSGLRQREGCFAALWSPAPFPKGTGTEEKESPADGARQESFPSPTACSLGREACAGCGSPASLVGCPSPGSELLTSSLPQPAPTGNVGIFLPTALAPTNSLALIQAKGSSGSSTLSCSRVGDTGSVLTPNESQERRVRTPEALLPSARSWAASGNPMWPSCTFRRVSPLTTCGLLARDTAPSLLLLAWH